MGNGFVTRCPEGTEKGGFFIDNRYGGCYYDINFGKKELKENPG